MGSEINSPAEFLSRRGLAAADGVRVAEAQMLGVEDGLVKERGDVVIVQGVDDLSSDALADHQSEVAQRPQLVRDRRGFHVDRVGEVTDRGLALAQTGKDPHPTGGGERLHRLGDLPRVLRR